MRTLKSQGGSGNSVKYNMRGGGGWAGLGGGGGWWGFCLFWYQWRKCMKTFLCTNKVIIYGVSAEAMWKQFFQIRKYDLVNATVIKILEAI